MGPLPPLEGLFRVTPHGFDGGDFLPAKLALAALFDGGSSHAERLVEQLGGALDSPS
jgi:hypothetical protein